MSSYQSTDLLRQRSRLNARVSTFYELMAKTHAKLSEADLAAITARTEIATLTIRLDEAKAALAEFEAGTFQQATNTSHSLSPSPSPNSSISSSSSPKISVSSSSSSSPKISSSVSS